MNLLQPIGYCRTGSLSGSWLSGNDGWPGVDFPNEDEVFAWQWDVEPSPDATGYPYSIEQNMLLTEGREFLRSLSIEWAAHHIAGVAGWYLFDEHGWGQPRASRAQDHGGPERDLAGLGSRALRSGRAKVMGTKIHSRQFAFGVVGELWPDLRAGQVSDTIAFHSEPSLASTVQALDDRGYGVTVTLRRGVLEPIEDVADSLSLIRPESADSIAGLVREIVAETSRRRQSPQVILRKARSEIRNSKAGHQPGLLQFSAALTGTKHCLAIFTLGDHWINNLSPSDPWLEVRQLLPEP